MDIKEYRPLPDGAARRTPHPPPTPTRVAVPSDPALALADWLDATGAAANDARNGAVLARGDRTGALTLLCVGKAPARDEVARGAPFTGPSGEILAGLLARAGLALEDGGGALATNASLWFAKAKTEPPPADLAATAPVLCALLERARPRAVLALGGVAATTLTSREGALATLRGHPHTCTLPATHQPPVWITFHPVNVLYEPRLRTRLEADFDHLGAHLRDTAH